MSAESGCALCDCTWSREIEGFQAGPASNAVIEAPAAEGEGTPTA
jgi:hypothetical protein